MNNINVRLTAMGQVIFETPDLTINRAGQALHNITWTAMENPRLFKFIACEFVHRNAPITIEDVTEKLITATNWMRADPPRGPYSYWITVQDPDGFRHTSLGDWIIEAQEGGRGVIRNEG